MRLRKGWTEKEYVLRLTFEEVLLIYKTQQNQEIQKALYEFGKNSNNINVHELYELVFSEKEIELLLENLTGSQDLLKLREKIEKVVNQIKDVFLVNLEAWGYGEPTENKVIGIFENKEDAKKYVEETYRIEKHFEDFESVYYRDWSQYSTLDISIDKMEILKTESENKK